MESTAVVPALCRLRTQRSGYLGPGRIERVQQAIAVVKGETVLVDATTKSFGVARAGDAIHLSYKLTNRGGKSVRIVGCRATCRCIVPGQDLPFTLRPRESRDFPISIRNPGRVAGTAPQTVNWQVTLYTTNPAQARIALSIKGEIQTNRPSSGS